MNIKFTVNIDGKTCSMSIDEKIVTTKIPYVPEKCVDHRGAYLKYYMGDEIDISIEDLDDSVESKQEVICGYNYMDNPVYVKKAIKNFKNRE